jgi:hypothetical protein
MVKYLRRDIYKGIFTEENKEELPYPVEQVAKHQNIS